MNKYQEALDRIEVHVPDYRLINNHIVEIDKHSDLCKLQELIDKETPIKLFYYRDEKCPKCNEKVAIDVPDATGFSDHWLERCNCGQVIDWNNEG